MKIVNPFNVLMYIVIYLVTAHYLRMKPFTTMNGKVGWVSDEGDHAVSYDPMTGCVRLYSLQQNGKVVQGIAIPDGKISSWFNTPKVYRAILHTTVGDYLEYKYDVEVDSDNDRE